MAGHGSEHAPSDASIKHRAVGGGSSQSSEGREDCTAVLPDSADAHEAGKKDVPYTGEELDQLQESLPSWKGQITIRGIIVGAVLGGECRG